MDLNLNIENIEYQVLFDEFGNFFLKSQDHFYQLEINGANIPYFEQENPNQFTFNTKDKLNKIIPLGENTLKKQVNKEIKEQDENYEEYFYEKNDFNEEENSESDDFIDEDNDTKFGEFNTKFLFSAPDIFNYSIVYHNEPIAALYDTYIYKDANLVFRSYSKTDHSLYILKIDLTLDKLSFRCIGSSDNVYQIKHTPENNLALSFLGNPS